MKELITALLFMMIAVPLAGEIKFFPFHDTFRISLGTPVFFFFLLWIRTLPPFLSGLIVGFNVVLFRLLWDGFLHPNGLSIDELFQLHYPVFFYYTTYACLFQLLNLNKQPYQPLRVGALDIITETGATFAELAFRPTIIEDFIHWEAYGKIVLIAVVRSFFVLGLYNIIQLRQAVLNEEQQRRQNEHTLVLISNLYEESVQLKKNLKYAENITRDSYDLYRSLLRAEQAAEPGLIRLLAERALRISGQVHEIKKDNQRIYAGLSKLIHEQSSADYMGAGEIGRLIVSTNEKYAEALGKSIRFSLDVDEALPELHVFTLLTLVNNLVANSVEAMDKEGFILIRAFLKGEYIQIHVIDNGPGIPIKRRERIFTPGYTTKYDLSGTPSTGMGLFYIQEVAESLGGKIELREDSREGETMFTITLPVQQVIKRG
ncbi:sensor histidine kinase [Paenibacillus sp. 32352]|uniref:sensor histidine kinase n=1 Tax=Paenibacillus sp. 32352 TaxID=1969111 RepID=UPI002119B62C|nr:sensor histidine kinase [Paenibacillus sp. 32352]